MAYIETCNLCLSKKPEKTTVIGWELETDSFVLKWGPAHKLSYNIISEGLSDCKLRDKVVIHI